MSIGKDLNPETIYTVFAISEPNFGCWIWLRNTNEDGYGCFSYKGRSQRAHRVSWEMFNGRAVPNGLQVHHSCDNPYCVNPDHLSVGTNQQNMIDMVRRGRKKYSAKFGEENPHSVLTRDLVASVFLHHEDAPTTALVSAALTFEKFAEVNDGRGSQRRLTKNLTSAPRPRGNGDGYSSRRRERCSARPQRYVARR